MITRNHLAGLAELARLAVKHKGNRAAITAELEADKEWARFYARHGLPRSTERGALPATIKLTDDDQDMLDRWRQ